ncbi:MAG TPA: uracil-DNA glycosylase [Gemmatimonadetes bacterium]|nr:uracil-DNA glycosylase [Gemmatimonadota bacterium]
MSVSAFNKLQTSVTMCRRCPRLVKWREQVAQEKRAAFRQHDYWGRPVPSFGDPSGRILVVGLAPAAHGANRPGRMFPGARSGAWLYRALHKFGFANQPGSMSRDDGLELKDVLITATVRCAPPANKPNPAEREACRSWLEQELDLVHSLRVIVTLGSFAYLQTLRILCDRGFSVPRPRPGFSHGTEVPSGDLTVLASFHPSQQNTFTGKLTEEMFDRIWSRAKQLIEKNALP